MSGSLEDPCVLPRRRIESNYSFKRAHQILPSRTCSDFQGQAHDSQEDSLRWSPRWSTAWWAYVSLFSEELLSTDFAPALNTKRQAGILRVCLEERDLPCAWLEIGCRRAGPGGSSEIGHLIQPLVSHCLLSSALQTDLSQQMFMVHLFCQAPGKQTRPPSGPGKQTRPPLGSCEMWKMGFCSQGVHSPGAGRGDSFLQKTCPEEKPGTSKVECDQSLWHPRDFFTATWSDWNWRGEHGKGDDSFFSLDCRLLSPAPSFVKSKLGANLKSQDAQGRPE